MCEGLLVLLIIFTLFTGCSDDTYLNDDDTGSTFEQIISFSVSPSSVPLGSEGAVSGSLVDTTGAGISGKQIVLSVTPSSSGYFLPAAVSTGSNGSFSSTFIPLQEGDIELSAATATQTALASYTAEITNDNGYQQGAWRFEFTSVPSFAVADGQEISTITVEIYDDENNAVEDGIVVRLEVGERFDDVNDDGYFTENVDTYINDINGNGIWDRVGTFPHTATTSGGAISFNYTAGTLAGLIYVKATVVEDGITLSGEHPMVLLPSEEIASIALSTDRSEIQVKATGGYEFANLTAICFDAFGNPVQSEIPVDFFIVYGPGGGERLQDSEFNPSQTSPDTLTAVTNVIGQAVITLNSGIKSGTVMMQARNGDVYSNATLININAGPPFEISVGVHPCNIRGWDMVNVTAGVIAIVNDTYGNPVMDSTEIFFWTDEGTIDAADVTLDGKGEVTYSSSDPRDDGIAIIRAETAGGTVADSTLLIVSGPADTVVAFGYATDLNANGEDYTDIYVDARDVNNNFLVDGTKVELLMNDGSIVSGNLSDGCYGSLARLRYKSSVLSRDYEYSVPDNGIGRILNGNVQVGGINGPGDGTTIVLHTGPSSAVSSEIKMDGTVSPGSTVTVDVEVKDRSGNPLGGHLIVPSANLGSLAPAVGVYTNSYGEASFTYTAPGAIGNDYVTITDEDPGYGGMVLTQKVKIDLTE